MTKLIMTPKENSNTEYGNKHWSSNKTGYIGKGTGRFRESSLIRNRDKEIENIAKIQNLQIRKRM